MINTTPINWDTLPGEDTITRTVLPNGIIVLSRTDFNSPSVVVSGYLQGGAIQDPRDKLGVALFTSYALMRGTANRRYRRIYHDLETAGASFGFAASVQTTSFGGRALAEDLPLLLSTLSDSIRWPIFPPSQIRKLQAQLIAGLQLRQQDTGDMASLKFDELLFPEHPYGLPEDGYLETVSNIRRKDLVQFHQKYYSPEGMVIVLVGAITAEVAASLVYKSLGGWQNPGWSAPPEIPSFSALTQTTRLAIPLAGKVQTDLVMGCHGPARVASDYLAASLGNNILGQFGMMGRIGAAVREKSGLAYYASTSLSAWLKAGAWEISAGINPLNVDAAIDLIIAELTRFISEPVSEEELEDAKAGIIGLLPLSVESNSGVASNIIRMQRYNLGLNYLREMPAMINAITPHEILKTAQRYINPEKLVIVTAGPAPTNIVEENE